MKRIFITGNSGAGKSTFAKRLSKKLDIPMYGLDKIVWKENWVKTPKEQREELIGEICDKDEWIIEGVSKQALEKADMVIFLNIPTYRCIFNILIRFVKNGLITRSDLPKNCPEYIGVFKALKIVFIYNKLTRPWLLKECTSDKVKQVKSYHELERMRFKNV